MLLFGYMRLRASTTTTVIKTSPSPCDLMTLNFKSSINACRMMVNVLMSTVLEPFTGASSTLTKPGINTSQIESIEDAKGENRSKILESLQKEHCQMECYSQNI